jgi:hypothetical protein
MPWIMLQEHLWLLRPTETFVSTKSGYWIHGEKFEPDFLIEQVLIEQVKTRDICPHVSSPDHAIRYACRIIQHGTISIHSFEFQTI